MVLRGINCGVGGARFWCINYFAWRVVDLLIRGSEGPQILGN